MGCPFNDLQLQLLPHQMWHERLGRPTKSLVLSWFRSPSRSCSHFTVIFVSRFRMAFSWKHFQDSRTIFLFPTFRSVVNRQPLPLWLRKYLDLRTNREIPTTSSRHSTHLCKLPSISPFNPIVARVSILSENITRRHQDHYPWLLSLHIHLGQGEDTTPIWSHCLRYELERSPSVRLFRSGSLHWWK